MSKVIVIGSQKGGVGKTTTTLNLAYSLCSMGKKVLAIDLDSQANLSTCYGIENTKNLEYTIGHLLMAQIEEEEPEELEHYIQSKDGVDFIPSSIYLSTVEAKLRTEMGAERMLAEVLVPIRDRSAGIAYRKFAKELRRYGNMRRKLIRRLTDWWISVLKSMQQ